jgi:hypothetical protein
MGFCWESFFARARDNNESTCGAQSGKGTRIGRMGRMGWISKGWTKEAAVSFRLWCSCGLALSLCVAMACAGEEVRLRAQPYDGIEAGLEAFRLAEERRQGDVAGQVALNEQLWYWPVWPGPGLPYMSAAGARVRQSIGQRQEQTGPRRWESHPVYAPPLMPYLPLPPVASPWLDGTPYAAPRVLAEPARVEVGPLAPLEPSRGLLGKPQPPEQVVPPPPPEPRRGPREY